MAGHARRHRGHGAAPGGGLAYRAVPAGALVLAALLLVPWLAWRATAWPLAPALAVLAALPAALYYWFRAVQRLRPRTALVLAIAYGVIAAGIAWALTPG